MVSNNESVNKVFYYLETAIKFLVATFLTVLVLVVFANVISRYFLSAAIAWSEELSRFLLIWVAFLGGVLAYTKDEHLGLDILLKVLPPKGARLVMIIANILTMIAISLITRGGYYMTMANLDWHSPALDIPYGYIYAIVPVCGTILIIQTIFKLITNIKALVQGSEEVKVKC